MNGPDGQATAAASSAGEQGGRIRERLGGPEYERLFAAARRRLEEAGLERALSVTLAGLRVEERRALADLHGWETLPRDRVRVSLRALDEALRDSRLGVGLVETVEALGGPLANRRAMREAARAERERLWAWAATEPCVRDRPVLRQWLDDLKKHGHVARAARTAGSDERAMLSDALRVVERLPASGALLAMLAADVLGDPHALDPDRPLATLVLRAAARLAGRNDVPAPAEARRRLWAEVGVVCDPLSSHALVLGLRPVGDDRLSRQLRESAEAGEPRRVTLRELSSASLRVSAGTRVFVCENASVMATVADRLGPRSAPLVCTEGYPSTAVLGLVRQLRDASADLRFHADFDWGGIQIGNCLVSTVAARPWRFEAADFRLALAQVAEAVSLGPASVAARWDADLATAMKQGGQAVFEEQVLSTLLGDLAQAAPR